MHIILSFGFDLYDKVYISLSAYLVQSLVLLLQAYPFT